MPAPGRKSPLLSSGVDRWLVLGGAGLLVLGLVLRLLTDIGRSTAHGDIPAPIADTTTATLPAPAVPPTTAETLAASPPTPAPPPVPAPVPRPTAAMKKPAASAPLSTAGWGVQLGAFGQRENAERLQQRVSGLGYEASVGTTGSLTRVRVVGLRDRDAAQQAADSIARALGTRGLVVAPGR